MSDSHQQDRDELLEAFLDGLLNEAERAAFIESLRANPARRRQVELQTKIDESLGRLFAVAAPSAEQLAVSLTGGTSNNVRLASTPAPATPSPRSSSDSRRGMPAYWVAATLAAAALIAVAVSLPWQRAAVEGPTFAARPLTDVYRDAVASGFEPTYECREPERFAATFQQRQGQGLQLAAMPAGARMLGLSYVGGLSRNTTAMLCYVEDQPVMVFVDRATDDRPKASAAADAGLHVFREERDGLIFYEVTPLAAPRVTALLEPIKADRAATGA